MITLRHCGIVITDEKEALRFYCDLLGLKIYEIGYEKNTALNSFLDEDTIKYIKLIDAKNNIIELYCNLTPETNELHHLAFTVKSLTEIKKQFKKYKIVNFSKIKKTPKVKVMFCCDYNNNLIELVEELK